jgi:hypothetical protein
MATFFAWSRSFVLRRDEESLRGIMRAVPRHNRLAFTLLLVSLAALVWAKSSEDGHSVRWAEGNAGCTFTHTDDGKQQYGAWSDSAGVTFAIDPQELQKSRLRADRLFAVLVMVKYRGNGTVDFSPDSIKLQFHSHHQVEHRALDPDELIQRFDQESDAMLAQVDEEIRKHPERKEEKEKALQLFQRDTSAMLQFVVDRSLHPAKLSGEQPEAQGWVFFSTKDKWIAGWKKREDFLLRVPVGRTTYEFPFHLPAEDTPTLLTRPDQQ